MILDLLSQWKQYSGFSSRMAAGFEYLQKTDFSKLSAGRYSICGEDVYAIVQDLQTKPREQGKWESHRKYIDIQHVLAGVEKMGYAPLGGLKVIHPYDEKDDYLLFEGEGNYFVVNAGMFAVFGPQDGHMPGLAVTAPAKVRKVVVKVRVD